MMHALTRAKLVAATVAVSFGVTFGAAHAQDGDADALAKQLSNPISSLISVPFQFNAAFGGGPTGDGEWYTLNIQPVVPLTLNTDWNLIVRTIVPLVGREDVFPMDSSVWGLGNIVQSFFFSPSQPTAGGLTWGVGPVFYYPTATDSLLGPEKWGAGPTAVALVQKGPWTTGLLWNQIWSFAGDDSDPDVNAMFFQPFVSRSLGKGQTLSANIQATYDWTSDQWTAPMTVGYAKVFKVGEQTMQFQVGAQYYLDKPPGGPDWGLQSTLTFLFPRAR
jgi:hypothetical protein